MTITEAFIRLMEIRKENPDLTFDNQGYEYLSPEVKEKHKEQIEEISSIMKKFFPYFRRFDNFKPRKDGTFSIRFQGDWSNSFTGVYYFGEIDFTEQENETI